jgi:hypothetical protein
MTVLSTAAPVPGVGARLRRRRGALIVIALVAATTVLLAWASRGATRGALDPDAFDDAGSRAVAEVLRDQGVDVLRVTSTVDAVAALERTTSAATLLIAVPDLLQEEQIRALADAAPDTVVLVAPQAEPALDAFAPGVAPVGEGGPGVREPACTWPPAVRAGAAGSDGIVYSFPGSGAVGCYPAGDGATVVATPSTTVLGAPEILRNDTVADDGNAALALGVLGAHPTLVWYLPSAGELAQGQASVLDLAPDWVPFVALWSFIVAIFIAVWRARRFGPVVVEPLPSRVRASETVEGRGRLYRRSRARSSAAAALRQAAIDRLVARSARDPRTDPTGWIQEIAERTGRPPADVAAILIGPVPDDDAALVRLAQNLRTLSKELT